MEEGQCYRCEKKIIFSHRPSRKEECPSCFSDIHVCRNCDFYDGGAYNECRETSAELVLDKEKANFCDYFKLGLRRAGQSASEQQHQWYLAAEALFKKKN